MVFGYLYLEGGKDSLLALSSYALGKHELLALLSAS